VRDPGLLINLYWLLTIGMAGAFAALFFRSLRISQLGSITFGVLYAIIPFAFYRNIAHLNLVHFTIPGAAYIGLSLARGESLPLFQNCLALGKSFTRRRSAVALVICLAVGLAYVYWAFFASIVVTVG